MTAPVIRTCLWFEKGGLEAARFYVRLIPNSHLEEPDDPDTVFLINFTLNDVPYQILNGGAHHKLGPACSIVAVTDDQTETDRLWDALTAGGGQEGRCGWLIDRWGVSWQIYPSELGMFLGADDKEAAGRAQAAMMEMNKIDIAKIRAAFDAD